MGVKQHVAYFHLMTEEEQASETMCVFKKNWTVHNVQYLYRFRNLAA
jgi:hypothetical protein